MKKWVSPWLTWEGIVFILFLLLDQGSKWLAYLFQVNWSIIPNFFAFIYTRNTGAAWSILSGQLPLLALISFLAGAGLIYYFTVYGSRLSIYYRWILVMIMAGTWGNFIDRAFYEEGVIDFISFQFGSYFFPTFNVADMLLTIGIVLLVFLSFMEEYVWKKKPLKSK